MLWEEIFWNRIAEMSAIISMSQEAGDDFLYEVYKEEALLLGVCKSKPSDKQVCHGFITFHLPSAAKKKEQTWYKKNGSIFS